MERHIPVALAPHRLGLLLVAAAAVLWSTAGYFTRAVPLDIAALLFWRGLFGAITSFVFVLVRERRNTLRAFAAMGRIGLLFCLLSSCGMACFVASLKLTSVAHVSSIYAAVPFAAAGLAWLVMRERVSPAVLAASLLALVGVAVTVAGGMGEGSLLGDVLALAMTLFVAAFMVLRRRFPDVPLVPAACVSALLPALASLPFVSTWPAHGQDIAKLIAFGVSNMGLALVFFTIGAKFIPAAQTALVGALETPLAPLWVWLAFGETPRGPTMLGGAMVLFAVIGPIAWDQWRDAPNRLQKCT
ncbi:DMT family transporter [Pendulispora rubella]|uniref:DMT family transporter n=1 Tax=Pendulispora rubella TaxID=2741070 RepID=A0ABZ2L8D1_9BACT